MNANKFSWFIISRKKYKGNYGVNRIKVTIGEKSRKSEDCEDRGRKKNCVDFTAKTVINQFSENKLMKQD